MSLKKILGIRRDNCMFMSVPHKKDLEKLCEVINSVSGMSCKDAESELSRNLSLLGEKGGINPVTNVMQDYSKKIADSAMYCAALGLIDYPEGVVNRRFDKFPVPDNAKVMLAALYLAEYNRNMDLGALMMCCVFYESV